MANSFDLSVNVRNANPSANIDFYYGTYESVAAACAAVPRVVRMIGKTVGIVQNGSIKEYWWKTGIEDSDLVLKFGTDVIIDNTFSENFTDLSSSGSVVISESTHKKGNNPLVQCYLNDSLILLDISSQNGDITVSWNNENITPTDTLTVAIVSVDYTYEIGNNDAFLIPISQSELRSIRPYMQCWWKDSVVTVNTYLTVEGDVVLDISEEISSQITDSDKLIFVAADNTNCFYEYITESSGSYTVYKAAHGLGNYPIVQCWLDNELILLDTEINEGNVTVSWNFNNSNNQRLYIVICNEAPSEQSADISDLVVIGEKNEGDGGITPTVEVGGIEKGKFINKDTFVNKLLRDMLTPATNPVITQPEASIKTDTAVGQRLLEVGDFIQPTIYIDYKQGDIKLNNVKIGNTAGEATDYVFNDSTQIIDNGTDNSITPIIQKNEECVVTYTGTVSYDEGDQPVDSEGKNYGNKLPAGTLQATGSILFEFVHPVYANTDINNLLVTYKQPLVSKSRKYIEITFPMQHGDTDRYTFETPASFNVVDIRFYNNFAVKYDDDSKLNDFSKTSITKNGVAYNRFTFKSNVYIELNTYKIIWE